MGDLSKMKPVLKDDDINLSKKSVVEFANHVACCCGSYLSPFWTQCSTCGRALTAADILKQKEAYKRSELRYKDG